MRFYLTIFVISLLCWESVCLQCKDVGGTARCGRCMATFHSPKGSGCFVTWGCQQALVTQTAEFYDRTAVYCSDGRQCNDYSDCSSVGIETAKSAANDGWMSCTATANGDQTCTTKVKFAAQICTVKDTVGSQVPYSSVFSFGRCTVIVPFSSFGSYTPLARS